MVRGCRNINIRLRETPYRIEVHILSIVIALGVVIAYAMWHVIHEILELSDTDKLRAEIEKSIDQLVESGKEVESDDRKWYIIVTHTLLSIRTIVAAVAVTYLLYEYVVYILF